jgi:hypothetical protein
MSDQVFQSPGSYRTNITALGVKPGVLTAQNGRLSFVGQDGHTYFDAPFTAFHSVGLAEMNETLEVWEGPTRHRVSLVSGGPLIGNIAGEFESDTTAKRWRAYLAPLVGSPPPDVHVKKPVSKALQLTLTILLSLLIVVAVFVVVFMLG